jgi:hypothetical protein
MGHTSGYFKATRADKTSEFAGSLNVKRTLYAYGAPVPPVIGGKAAYVYFIDAENGVDTNDGKTWATAFKTLEKCFGNTTGNKVARDDYSDDAAYYVFVAPGTYAPTLPLRLYGHGMHVIGLGTPGTDSGVNITDTAAVGASNGLVLLAGANSSIENIQFNMTTDIPAVSIIKFDNSYIDSCVFNSISSACTKAIWMMDLRCTEIVNCTFGVAGGCFAYAFYSTTGADQYLIDSYIHHNRIYSAVSGAKGIYVHSNVVTYGTVIDNNWVNLSTAAGSPIGIDNDASGVIAITRNMVFVPTTKTPIESASSPTGILHNATQAGAAEADPNTANG